MDSFWTRYAVPSIPKLSEINISYLPVNSGYNALSGRNFPNSAGTAMARLKILVSAVQFRPQPPFLINKIRCLCGPNRDPNRKFVLNCLNRGRGPGGRRDACPTLGFSFSFSGNGSFER